MQIPKEIPSISSMPSIHELLEAAGWRSRPSAGVDVVAGMSLFAAGLLVGAGLGLLFAPSSGERLRADLGERITDLRERLDNGLAREHEDTYTPNREQARTGRVA
jgi:hypothetical protein